MSLPPVGPISPELQILPPQDEEEHTSEHCAEDPLLIFSEMCFSVAKQIGIDELKFYRLCLEYFNVQVSTIPSQQEVVNFAQKVKEKLTQHESWANTIAQCLGIMSDSQTVKQLLS